MVAWVSEEFVFGPLNVTTGIEGVEPSGSVGALSFFEQPAMSNASNVSGRKTFNRRGCIGTPFE
jgi:hypothetical protein